MRLLRFLLRGTTTDPEMTLPSENPEHRQRLESHLRDGARALSAQTPAGLRGRIMDQVQRDRVQRDSESSTPELVRHPAPRWQRIPLAATLAAAALLAFLYTREETSSKAESPAPIAELTLGVFDLIEPMLQAPGTANLQLEQEAQNLLEDSQRLLVLVLPTKLSKPLEEF